MIKRSEMTCDTSVNMQWLPLTMIMLSAGSRRHSGLSIRHIGVVEGCGGSGLLDFIAGHITTYTRAMIDINTQHQFRVNARHR